MLFKRPQRRHAAMPVDIVDVTGIGSAALLGSDCPGLRPDLSVDKGDRVRVGQILFADRNRPQIRFAAPISGMIQAVEFGARRSLSAIVIKAGTPDIPAETASAPDATDMRKTLLETGYWPAFRSRPFGRIPDPDAVPDAIFVTMTDPDPHAPDPRLVLAGQQAEFDRGLEALQQLTNGAVHVCRTNGQDPVTARDRVQVHSFPDRHPFGLAAAHIARLHPHGTVWTIGYQDVTAIGRFLQTGRYSAARVVTVSGPGYPDPHPARTVQGAAIADVLAGLRIKAGGDHPVRLLSGSALTGWDSAYLGRYHNQVTVLDASPPAPRSTLLSRFAGGSRTAPGRALFPTGALEHALPTDMPPVPLMRALSVGDIEAAERLGCLDLIEEDVAMLSALCTSGADYGSLLRGILDDLEKAA